MQGDDSLALVKYLTIHIFIKRNQQYEKSLHLVTSQLTFTCLNSTIKTLEKGVKLVQS